MPIGFFWLEVAELKKLDKREDDFIPDELFLLDTEDEEKEEDAFLLRTTSTVSISRSKNSTYQKSPSGMNSVSFLNPK